LQLLELGEELTVLLADSLLVAAFCTALIAALSWISPAAQRKDLWLYIESSAELNSATPPVNTLLAWTHAAAETFDGRHIHGHV